MGRPVTKHEEPSTQKLAGARWRPMLSTHPYTDNIRGNCGPFRGCVVVSTKLSGSNPDARTSLPTHHPNQMSDGRRRHRLRRPHQRDQRQSPKREQPIRSNQQNFLASWSVKMHGEATASQSTSDLLQANHTPIWSRELDPRYPE